MAGYEIVKPNTSYQSEEGCPFKFINCEDFTIDKAVADIVARREDGMPFTFPNSNLLASAVMGKQWWSTDNA